MLVTKLQTPCKFQERALSPPFLFQDETPWPSFAVSSRPPPVVTAVHSWSFMIFPLLTSTGHLFGRMTLSLSSSDVFSWSYWRCAFWAGISQKCCVSFLGQPVRACMILTFFFFVTPDINLNQLVRVSVGFVYCKVTIFPYITDKYLGWDTLKQCWYLESPQILLNGFCIIHWYLLPATIITAAFA